MEAEHRLVMLMFMFTGVGNKEGKVANLICLGAGLILGIVLGWGIFIAILTCHSDKEPPSKEEWKVM